MESGSSLQGVSLLLSATLLQMTSFAQLLRQGRPSRRAALRVVRYLDALGQHEALAPTVRQPLAELADLWDRWAYESDQRVIRRESNSNPTSRSAAGELERAGHTQRPVLRVVPGARAR